MTVDEGTDAVTSVAVTPSERARRLGRVALVAGAAVGTAIGILFGLATLAADLPDVAASFPAAPYALDGARHIAVAMVVAAGGDAYSVAGYFYPPLGALVAMPFAAIGAEAGLWAWFVVKIAIVVWCALDATRGQRPVVRAAVLAFLMTSTYVLDDLWLGNVSIVISAALYLAVSRDRPVAGVPLGIVLAAVAKPFLLPVLLWMFVFRRRSGIATAATALVATGIAVVVLGPSAYRDYLAALTGAIGLDLSFGLGLSGVAPGLLVPASIAALATFVVLLWASRDESSLLIWSLLVGLIAAPYIGHYSVIPVLAGIPAFARMHPTRTLAMAAVIAPIALVALLPAIVLGLIVAFPTDVFGRAWNVDPESLKRSRSPG